MMRLSVLALAAVAFGLLAGTASACPYNQVVQTVAVQQVAVQSYAAPVAVVQTPVVVSQVAVVPVFAVQNYGYNQAFAVNQHNVYGGNFVQRGFNNQRAVNGGGKGALVDLKVGPLRLSLGGRR